MKKVLLLATGLCFVLAGSAWAFHDKGVAQCNGCHTMHNSQNNVLVDPDSPSGNDYLLKDATPSDVCLNCHATSRGAVFSVDVLNPAVRPGGNFIFLLEDNLNDGHGGGDSANFIPGDAAGHNLNAPGHGLSSDLTLTSAPGGTFNSEWLGCSSCHDPHGNANFRLLYGARSIQDGLYSFSNAAPVATKISSLNGTETNTNHTAYKSGMSQWCSNCHSDFHNDDYPGTLKHPSGDVLGASIAAAYNAYNGTSDQTGGATGTAYLAAVPFEDTDTLYTATSTRGPSSQSKVMCLTCHRAHASSAPDAGRWDFNIPGLAEDGAASGSYAIPNPYDAYQRSLCNKCHVKDADDALVDFTP